MPSRTQQKYFFQKLTKLKNRINNKKLSKISNSFSNINNLDNIQSQSNSNENGTEKNVSKLLRYTKLLAKLGNTNAMLSLSRIGNEKSRMTWLKRAAISGHDKALLEYSSYLENNGDTEGAIALLIRCSQRTKSKEVKGKSFFQLGSLILNTIKIDSINDDSLTNENEILDELDEIFDENNKEKSQDNLNESQDNSNESQEINLKKSKIELFKWNESEHQYYGELAVLLFEEGIIHGNVDSMCALAECYKKGIGVSEVSEENAFKLYLAAAEGGSSLAQFKVYKCYLKGIGTEQSESKAGFWLQKSSENDFDQAHFELGSSYLVGDLGFSIDKNKAFELFSKGSLAGNYQCQFILGQSYQLGIGCDKDEKKSFYWYKQASLNGYAEAQHQLGFYYENGIGVEKNLESCFEWYQVASNLEYPPAIYELGRCYEHGIGTEISPFKAFTQYNKASNYNYPTATMSLIRCYILGIGVNQDLRKALEIAIDCSKLYNQAKPLISKLQKLVENKEALEKKSKVRKSKLSKRKDFL